ncbi:cytochrome P450 [Spinellus fusiger]|nr:cytochrome P450 [Spinellus fusiger]
MSSTSIPFLDGKYSVISLLKDYPLQTVSVVAISTALYALYSGSKDKKNDGFDKIPMPKGKYPYFGHLPHLGENSFLKTYEWHKELGPVIHVKMGVQDFIFISDPAFAHEVFNTNGLITSSRPYNAFCDKYYSPGERSIVFSNYGKKWKNARSIVNSLLSPKYVDKLEDTFQLEKEHMVNQLISGGNSPEGLDPVDYLTLGSLNVMLRICCDTCVESVEDKLFIQIMDIMNTNTKFVGIDENLEKSVPIFTILRNNKRRNKIRQDFIDNLRDLVMRGMVNEALERDTDCLIRRMKEKEKEKEFDEDDLMILTSDLIIGGTHTVSMTISWALAMLSHYPETQKKICTEIDVFIAKHKRLPMFEEHEELPFLICVQREIIRLFPTTPYGVPHVAEQDFIVNNYMIKKETVLISDMYSMHRNPDIYPDPEKFIPERFSNNKSTFHASANGNTKDRDQFTFGWGRRICPGIHLAELHIFLMYINLWARCTIEPALDDDGNPVYADLKTIVDGGLVMKPKPYKLRFVERPNKMI